MTIIQDREYQTAAVNSIFQYFVDGNTGNPLVAMPTGCHAKGHEILMYDGSLKLVEDIIVGDLLMGIDSTPRTVLHLARGRQEMRRVIPNKGEPFVVNKDHKLLIRVVNQGIRTGGTDCPSRRSRDEVLTISEYQNGSNYFKHLRKLQHGSVEFEEKSLPLPPYFIGLLLGDGSTVNGTVNLTTMDKEISDYVVNLISDLGLETKISKKDKGLAWNIGIRDPLSCNVTPNRVTKILRDLGIQEKRAYEKSIPFDYKTCSRSQRLELLAGLLDTDGYYSKDCNYFEYTSSSPDLAKDVLFLIKSLGFRGMITQNPTTHRDSYRINITGDIDTIPTLLPRKQARASSKQKDHLIMAFTVENLPEDNYYGFTLSGDHLYYDKNFVIHHNTGKSIVIGRFIQNVYKHWPSQKVLMLTHVKELIQQNYEKIISLWPTAPVGIYSAGLGRKELNTRIICAGIASIAKQAHLLGKVNLILIDECHLVSPNDETMYREFIKELKIINPSLKIIGFTATPWRLGFGSLTNEGGIFTDICFNITDMNSFNRLIEEGYLLPPIPKSTEFKLDLEGISTRQGDYAQGELQSALDKTEITYAALEETIQVGKDRKSWLIFASGVDHAIHIADILSSMGIATKAVHSKMSGEERDTIIRDFKSGKLRCVVNNSVLTTGFDHPEIDLIVMLRPTKSVVLWIQMLGRGTRPVYAKGFDLQTIEGRLQAIKESPKQNCLVLDFAGNTATLGPINDPVIPRKKGEKGGEAPVKTCEVCGVYNHTIVKFCIACGNEFQFKVKITARASTDQLIKQELPIVEVFKVSSINYSMHNKPGKPPMLKVSYFCGLRKFDEYICFEHEGFAQRKAREWWKARTTEPFQASSKESLELVSNLKAASHIRVWVNKQFPEIKAYCFDGSAFGTVEACELDIPPIKVEGFSKTNYEIDDDLPF
jgi:DNA repair protein RadD